MQHFGDIAFGEHSLEHQRRRGSYDSYREMRSYSAASELGPDEIRFLRERDSFYLSSVGEQGWPYVQHRGGPVGFVRVIDPTHIAWADVAGNRQYVSAGNLDHDDRVAIIAVDYPNRRRLKLLGHARFDTAPDPETLARIGISGRMEGLVTVEVVASEWNCPKQITPRYTAEQVQTITDPMAARIRDLEAELAALRAIA
jgi:predicted pyridoxine 5'-phosphate oxidase superfamily flavin-nucleotide-binding protein